MGGYCQDSRSECDDNVTSNHDGTIGVLDPAISADSWLNVFVDESGTFLSGGRMPDDSQFFICVAVLVDDAKLDATAALVDSAAAALGGGAEVKSSRIGARHDLRIRYLEAVQDADFLYSWLLVDKTMIGGESGLRFQTSFHKFFKRLLQRPLTSYSGTGVRVFFDRYGSPRFMERFEQYMDEQLRPSLWFGYEDTHVRSCDSRLVQLADLIAGTLSYCFEPAKRCDQSHRFRELIGPKELSAVMWPPPAYPSPGTSGADPLDGVLGQRAVARANQLICNLGHSDSADERLLAATLEHLLFSRVMEDPPRQSVYADRLLELLSDQGFEISSRSLRTAVGGLRDRGVIVAGSASGYKLAFTVADIQEYLAHSAGVISPMLHRVDRARQTVKLDTLGKHDILCEGWAGLGAMVDALADSRLPVPRVAGDDAAEPDDVET